MCQQTLLPICLFDLGIRSGPFQREDLVVLRCRAFSYPEHSGFLFWGVFAVLIALAVLAGISTGCCGGHGFTVYLLVYSFLVILYLQKEIGVLSWALQQDGEASRGN